MRSIITDPSNAATRELSAKEVLTSHQELVLTIKQLEEEQPEDLAAQVAEKVVKPSLNIDLQLRKHLVGKSEQEQTILPAAIPIDPLVLRPAYQQGLRHLIPQYDIDDKSQRRELKKALSLLEGEEGKQLLCTRRLYTDRELKDFCHEVIVALGNRFESSLNVAADGLVIEEYYLPDVHYSKLEVSILSRPDVKASLYYSHFKFQSLLAESYYPGSNRFETGYEQFALFSFKYNGQQISLSEVSEVSGSLGIPKLGRFSGDMYTNIVTLRSDYDDDVASKPQVRRF